MMLSKKIAIIDGMGGGIGAQLIAQMKQELTEQVEIIALGTNSQATLAMLKAGAQRGATGENAIRVNIREADCIAGPLGIIIADALMGEITPVIAQLIAQAACPKILLPVNQSHVEIVGLESRPLNQVIKEAVGKIKDLTLGIAESSRSTK